MARDGLPLARRLENRRHLHAIIGAVIVSCLLLGIFNPLRWWYPRTPGERSPGTTTGWLDDAGAPPTEIDPDSYRRRLV